MQTSRQRGEQASKQTDTQVERETNGPQDRQKADRQTSKQSTKQNDPSKLPSATLVGLCLPRAPLVFYKRRESCPSPKGHKRVQRPCNKCWFLIRGRGFPGNSGRPPGRACMGIPRVSGSPPPPPPHPLPPTPSNTNQSRQPRS